LGAPHHALEKSDMVAPASQAPRRRRAVIPVYVINLARSPERKAWMEGELGREGLAGIFVRAVDGRRFGARCNSAAEANPARPPLSRAEAALTLSHRKVWRKLLASGAEHAAILEDDIHLGRRSKQALDLDWTQWEFDAVKLETLFHVVWLERRGRPAGGRKLHRLGAEHLASAAYLISRTGARKMLAATRDLREPLDHTLFGRRPIGEGAFLALQLVPAIAVQDTVRPNSTQRSELASTLHEGDRKQNAAKAKQDKPKGSQRFLREAERLGEQLRRWIRLTPTMHRRRIPWE
jgi:glycosyl transferase family 25